MKNTLSSPRSFFPSAIIACCLCVASPAIGATATFNITPSTISNTYGGAITLNIGSLTNTEPVLVDKFLDANTNNILDAGDPLVARFQLTDGEATVIAGVTNRNVPGDWDAAAGAISSPLNLRVAGIMHQLSGKYLHRLSSPTGRFTPVTNLLTITNFPYSQSFTGRVVTGAVNVSNSVVLLFTVSDTWGLGRPIAGTVVGNAGGYTLKAPPGTYALLAFKTNRLTDMRNSPVLTLNSNATISTNLSLLTGGARTISGRVVDAANTNLALGGLLLLAESTNSLMGIGFTDTNGNYTIGVTNGLWRIRPGEDQLAARGYLGFENESDYPGCDVSASNATGVILALPQATALIYGRITNNLGQPLPGVTFGEAGNGTNTANGITDEGGDYWLGVTAGHWDGSIDALYSGYGNYVFSSGFWLEVSDGEAVRHDFSALLATNFITGYLRETNGTPIGGVSLWAWADIGGITYQNTDGLADDEGNYSLALPNGTWNVMVNCSGDDHGLYSHGNYSCPPPQAVVIANNNGVANFDIYPAQALAVITTTLPDGTNGASYGVQLQAVGGQQPYNWTLFSGSLPPGVNLYSSGWLAGVPSGTGTWNFTARVTDGQFNIADQPLALTIQAAVPPLVITTASLPNATNGVPYSQQLQATGGTMPYTWAVTSGSLPAGVNLSTNGLLAGTPTTNGTFNFMVGVTDSGARFTNANLALTVLAPVVPDVVSYYVAKLKTWRQLDAATLILNSNVGPFQALIGLVQSGLNTVPVANVTLPTGAVRGLPFGSTDLELANRESFVDETAFEAAYPAGDYTFGFYAVHDGLKFLSLNQPAATYPVAPHISNFAACQAIHPANPFTLQWDALAGAGAYDPLWLAIYDTNGTLVFSTPHPAVDAAGALKATTTSVLITNNTLQLDYAYLGALTYFKATTVDTTSYPGAVGLAVFGTQTWFPLTTRSPVPTLSNPERINPNVFRFTVNGLAGQNYTIQASWNLVNWNSIRTTNAPADVFTIQLNQATNSRSAYRLMVEP
jgi:hypothetical protein